MVIIATLLPPSLEVNKLDIIDTKDKPKQSPQKQQKTRKNGDGYIYQRGNRFYGKLRNGSNADGSPKTIYFSGSTKTEVKQKISDYKKTSLVVNSRMTVERFLIYWMKTYKYGRIKNPSYDRIETTLKSNIIPYIGLLQLQSLSSADITSLLLKLKTEKGLSYSSIKKAFDCLRSALNVAVYEQIIARNPMTAMKMLAKDQFNTKTIEVFTQKEAEMIVAECKRTYCNGEPVRMYGDAFILILNTGLRLSEALALELSDWDRDAKTIRISKNDRPVFIRDKNGDRTGGKHIVQGTGKSAASTRTIPLNVEATAALERMESRAVALRSQRFICSSKGEPVPTDRFERAWYSILSYLKLKQTGVHTLRHTFASFLFQKKVDIKVISALLGHSSISITYNTYVHVMPEDLSDAVRAIDAVESQIE